MATKHRGPLFHASVLALPCFRYDFVHSDPPLPIKTLPFLLVLFQVPPHLSIFLALFTWRLLPHFIFSSSSSCLGYESLETGHWVNTPARSKVNKWLHLASGGGLAGPALAGGTHHCLLALHSHCAPFLWENFSVCPAHFIIWVPVFSFAL